MEPRKEEITLKMIREAGGNVHDIEHFMKVLAYASLIGRAEKLDQKTQDILEMTAVVHDIACPLCRIKYGNTNGKYQEQESELLLREFFEEFDLEKDELERIIYLVCHHHTYTAVDGVDYQILLEADFLVNASEGSMSEEAIRKFQEDIAKTKTGQQLLREVYRLG